LRKKGRKYEETLLLSSLLGGLSIREGSWNFPHNYSFALDSLSLN
jgi:hypothetical protein